MAGKYEILKVLGEGGAGVVVSARHTSLDRVVALKFLRAEKSRLASYAESFVSEARAMFDIVNDHVVRVFDLDSLPDGTPFMVMELLEGSDLRQEMPERAVFTPAYVAEFGRQICAGLMAAHAVGVVHRDIKPENIFVRLRPDGGAHFTLLDFGISRVSTRGATTRTDPGRLATGTPAYMSPEQVRASSDFDSRSDIWSLGCVLYEMLTGIAPFKCATPELSCTAVLEQRVAAARQHRPDLDGDLEAIVMRCLSKQPRDRFSCAEDLMGALEQWLAARNRSLHGAAREPIETGKPGDRARNRVPALVLTACAVIAFGALGVVLTSPATRHQARGPIAANSASVLRPLVTEAARTPLDEPAARDAPVVERPFAPEQPAPRRVKRAKPLEARLDPDVGY